MKMDSNGTTKTTLDDTNNNAKKLEHSSNSLGSLPERVAQSGLMEEKETKEEEDLPRSTAAASSTSPTTNNHDKPREHTFQEEAGITMIGKFAKERIIFTDLSPQTTIGQFKGMLQAKTRILPKRQKLVGLLALQGGVKGVTDDLPLSGLKIKGKNKNSNATTTTTTIVHEFILMGTPEEEIFVDPQDRDDLPEVVDDLDLDFLAGSEEWLRHVANQENLKSFTDKTQVHIMNPMRPGKPLMVLDLDHTLLDFSSKSLQRASTSAQQMKRPYMDEFLTQCYPHYDMVIWSQTNWRYIELKLTELGMLANPGYRFAFILDKTSMFTVTSTRRNGASVQHHVKPLQIIWSKFPRYNSSNTVHIDDLTRNFALNLSCGLPVTAYYRKKKRPSSSTPTGSDDVELWALAKYLKQLAQAQIDFEKVDFAQWRAVCEGSIPMVPAEDNDGEDKDETMQDNDGSNAS